MIAISVGAHAGTDIPCDKLSAGIEIFQCKSVKRSYKIGLQTNENMFCAENEQVILEKGCVINGLTAVENEISGSEKILQKTIYATIPAKVTRDQVEKFQLQCEPEKMSGGVKPGSNIGHRIKGFTASDLPGKDNGDRNKAWEDSLAPKGKRWFNSWVVNVDPNASKTESQTCILYNAATNTKLLEFNAEIQKKSDTKVPMPGPKPGGSFGNFFR
jgi:hypothetical protein